MVDVVASVSSQPPDLLLRLLGRLPDVYAGHVTHSGHHARLHGDATAMVVPSRHILATGPAPKAIDDSHMGVLVRLIGYLSVRCLLPARLSSRHLNRREVAACLHWPLFTRVDYPLSVLDVLCRSKGL